MPSPDSIAQSQARLQAQGLDRLDAQLLLLHVLDLPAQRRGWLLAHDREQLAPEQITQLSQLAQRRLAGEPLAYLTGYKAFFGLNLQVDARVLVPRPDTETLVEWALSLLAGEQRVLDLGTGSGAIALALKSRQPALQVLATDASADALALAQANARQLQLDVDFSQGAWFDAPMPPGHYFDAIVSNPPYIAEHDWHLDALRHEPRQALTSGADGLADLRQIIVGAPHHLRLGAWLLLEHGFDQAQAVRALLDAAGFKQVQSRRDLAGIERCSGGQWPNPSL